MTCVIRSCCQRWSEMEVTEVQGKEVGRVNWQAGERMGAISMSVALGRRMRREHMSENGQREVVQQSGS